jgi:hypothetical protein
MVELRIKEIPFDLQLLAFKNQSKQGNLKDDSLLVSNGKSQGNFNWSESFEGEEFWQNISKGEFPETESIEDIMNQIKNL